MAGAKVFRAGETMKFLLKSVAGILLLGVSVFSSNTNVYDGETGDIVKFRNQKGYYEVTGVAYNYHDKKYNVKRTGSIKTTKRGVAATDLILVTPVAATRRKDEVLAARQKAKATKRREAKEAAISPTRTKKVKPSQGRRRLMDRLLEDEHRGSA